MPKYPRRAYRAFYKADDIDADTWVILVDLDDETNYDHADVSSVTILGMDIATEKASDGRYDIHVGVVKENDTTDGSAQWVKSYFLNADGNATDGTDRFVDRITFVYPDAGVRPQGIDCTVHSGATPWIAGTASGNQTALDSDAGNLANAGGGSSKSAAVGDIVLFVDEGTTGGTISVALGIDYVVS